MIGYHYTDKQIPLNSIITSNQHKASRWKFAHIIYVQEALNRGLIFPDVFGYAYPTIEPNMSMRYEYKVEAPESSCITGDPNYSIWYLLGCRIKDPVEIQRFAVEYFNCNCKRKEVISATWRVVQVVDRKLRP